MKNLEFEIGDRVLVEVVGRVVVRQEFEGGAKYIIQPLNHKIPAIHASPEIVFAPDNDEPTGAEIIHLKPRLRAAD